MQFMPAVAPVAGNTPDAWCFVFVEGQLLLVEQAEGHGLAPQPWSLFQPHEPQRHYLGQLDGIDCWTFALKEPPPGFKRTPLRAAMMQFDETLMGVAGRAAQVLEWDRAHRFCGVCGTPTEAQPNERSRKCPACGHTAYPRLSPAMMVLVWRDGEVLLARSPHYVPGVYSALAGFVEAGESIEQCIHREVAEEVGVQVTDLRYYGSQSWPFPHSLMIAYTARWTDGAIVKQDGEIEDAQWYALDALPKIPPRFSISGHLIRDTVVSLGGPEPGPGVSVVR
ncbi:MAG TPA: NAD(+) diphosphatase [Burkholderiaceae bacterium]